MPDPEIYPEPVSAELPATQIRLAELESLLAAKESELALVSAQAEKDRRFYQTILSGTPDLVYVFGLDYRFTYANEALLKTWGRTWETSIGKGLLELGYPDWHAAMHEREIDQVVATRRPIRGEVAFNGTDGRRMYDYIFVPVFSDAGQVEAVAGTTRDVTEMVEARETVSDRRVELERQVSERTSELQQAVEQLEEFSYSVSHDLRAPSRAIGGYAGVLLEDFAGQFNSAAKTMIERIQRNSQRMEQLTQGLLDYTRIRRQALVLKPVAVEPIIREVVDLYPLLKPDKADLEILSPLPPVMAHEPALLQIVANLLGNAVKFTPAGIRPRVQIGSDQKAGKIRIWFQDNGIGIPPESQRRLFSLFERLHPHQGYEGTGIGLAIVRKAMERMNGTVGVESDGTAGSRFWIEFPAPSPET
jgi:hypothetical protein